MGKSQRSLKGNKQMEKLTNDQIREVVLAEQRARNASESKTQSDLEEVLKVITTDVNRKGR